MISFVGSATCFLVLCMGNDLFYLDPDMQSLDDRYKRLGICYVFLFLSFYPRLRRDSNPVLQKLLPPIT